MPAQIIIKTTDLTKQYGKVLCVNKLNMNVPQGTVYGFLGPNGAGKSTTLKMILGLAKPTKGTITLFDSPVCERNRIHLLANTGSLIESPSYYGHLTGEENLTNTVRKHPEIEEYVQVYDRTTHEWNDVREDYFWEFQEKKKQMMGKDYQAPITI